MKDRMHDQGLDKLSRYGQDDLVQLAFAVEETLPIMLKVGSKARCDCTQIGHRFVVHFSPGVTTEINSYSCDSIGLSSLLMLIETSLVVLYFVFCSNCVAVPLLVVKVVLLLLRCIGSSVTFPTVLPKIGSLSASDTDSSPS